MNTARADTPEYRKAYNAGWKSTADLDYADARGLSSNVGWMDGHGDAFAGRPKWHSLTCTVVLEVGWHTTDCG